MEGLRTQTLSPEKCELLLIDNASAPALGPDILPASYPHARLIAEPQLGLTSARLSGIRNAAAPLLVFIDDDNVLDPRYLELAIQIGREWPQLGVWGGQTIAEFETRPPDWAEPFLGYLALRTRTYDAWSNVPFDKNTYPFGAGMCARRVVVEKFEEISAAADPLRLRLARHGSRLFGAEDLDICLTAHDVGLGTGVFRDLKLLHLIPQERLTEAYFVRLLEDLAYSQLWMEHFRGRPPKTEDRSDVLFRYYKILRARGVGRRLALATERGRSTARREIREALYDRAARRK